MSGLIGEPLSRALCQKFVDAANKDFYRWEQIRIDGLDFRVFAFDIAPEIDEHDAWINRTNAKVQVGVIVPHLVDWQKWGICRTDWEAILAEEEAEEEE